MFAGFKVKPNEAIELRVGVAWGRTGGHNEGILTQLPILGKVSSMWITFYASSPSLPLSQPPTPLSLHSHHSFLLIDSTRVEINIRPVDSAFVALLKSSRIGGFRIFQSSENN